MVRNGCARCGGRSEVDAFGGANAGIVSMLYVAHFGDSVGYIDKRCLARPAR